MFRTKFRKREGSPSGRQEIIVNSNEGKWDFSLSGNESLVASRYEFLLLHLVGYKRLQRYDPSSNAFIQAEIHKPLTCQNFNQSLGLWVVLSIFTDGNRSVRYGHTFLPYDIYVLSIFYKNRWGKFR